MDAAGPTAAAVAGAVMFARYAYPPNELGYCGPADSDALIDGLGDLDRVVAYERIRAHAREFEGAWPYVKIIGNHAGRDPLDPAVVEAYWLGGPLLDAIPVGEFVSALTAEFRGQIGGTWGRWRDGARDGLPAGGPSCDDLPHGHAAGGPVPHHSFQVFEVYPWVPLLRRSGPAGHAVPLSVLDQCRIRWGQVLDVIDDRAVVRSRPLVFDGHSLSLGAEREESVRWSEGGRSLLGRIEPGESVALHWDWVCDRLTAQQLEALETYSGRQLDLTNTWLAGEGGVPTSYPPCPRPTARGVAGPKTGP